MPSTEASPVKPKLDKYSLIVSFRFFVSLWFFKFLVSFLFLFIWIVSSRFVRFRWFVSFRLACFCFGRLFTFVFSLFRFVCLVSPSLVSFFSTGLLFNLAWSVIVMGYFVSIGSVYFVSFVRYFSCHCFGLFCFYFYLFRYVTLLSYFH